MSGEVGKTREITFHQNEVKIDKDGGKVEKEYQNTIFTIKDDDGIIQKEDVTMSIDENGLNAKGKKLFAKITAFFEKNVGKKWNFFNKNYLIILADRFNRKNSYKSKDVTYDKYGDVEKSYTTERSNDGQVEVTNTSKKNWLGQTKTKTVTTDQEKNTKEIQTEKRDSHGTVRKATNEIIDKDNQTDSKEIKKFRKDGSLKKVTTYKKNKENGTTEVVVTKYDKKGNVTHTDTYTAKDYKPKLEDDSEE